VLVPSVTGPEDGRMTTPPHPPYPQQEDVTLSVLCHLSVFGFGLIAPLVIYLISKDDPYKQMTRWHAAEALNFHLSLLIYGIVSVILILVLVGIVLLLALGVTAVVLGIIAAIAASERKPYRYPLTIHFVH
jgi:uncharacterized Tic20 family protein